MIRLLRENETAVDVENGTGHEACGVGGHEQDRVRDILGLAQAPERDLARHFLHFTNLRERKDALAGVEPVPIGVVLRENLP